jgi:hypothetical protein
MLTPKNITNCSNGVKPKQSVARIEIKKAKARPKQLAAWRRLWAKLLAAPTRTAAVDRPDEGKASICQSNEMRYQENGNDHT